MLPLNRYLGWVKRWYNTAEAGPTPDVVSTLDVSRDWPAVPTTLNLDYATPAAGTATVQVYAPAIGRHGLVTFLSSFRAGGIAGGDTLQLIWDRNPTAAPGINLSEWIVPAGGCLMIPLINTIATEPVNGWESRGQKEIYVPSGFRLVLTHTTAGAGQAMTCRAQVYDLPDYSPMVRL